MNLKGGWILRFGNWCSYLCASWGMGEGWYQAVDSGGGGSIGRAENFTYATTIRYNYSTG